MYYNTTLFPSLKQLAKNTLNIICNIEGYNIIYTYVNSGII